MKITRRHLRRIIKESMALGSAPAGAYFVLQSDYSDPIAFHESVVENPTGLQRVESAQEALTQVSSPDFLYYPNSHAKYASDPDDASFVWSNVEEIINSGSDLLTVQYADYLANTFEELAYESSIYM